MENLFLSEANPTYVLPLRSRKDQQKMSILYVLPPKGTFENLENPHNVYSELLLLTSS